MRIDGSVVTRAEITGITIGIETEEAVLVVVEVVGTKIPNFKAEVVDQEIEAAAAVVQAGTEEEEDIGPLTMWVIVRGMAKAMDTRIISRIMMMRLVRVMRLVVMGTALSFRHWEVMGEIGMGTGLIIHTGMVGDCHTNDLWISFVSIG